MTNDDLLPYAMSRTSETEQLCGVVAGIARMYNSEGEDQEQWAISLWLTTIRGTDVDGEKHERHMIVSPEGLDTLISYLSDMREGLPR